MGGSPGAAVAVGGGDLGGAVEHPAADLAVEVDPEPHRARDVRDRDGPEDGLDADVEEERPARGEHDHHDDHPESWRAVCWPALGGPTSSSSCASATVGPTARDTIPAFQPDATSHAPNPSPAAPRMDARAAPPTPSGGTAPTRR